ncbi:MAG TPA: hypothetical protein VMP08_15835 [Anaerolineae bacterium]|nr:hypothetical protein [Anaerolineae bacterium]
MEPIQVIELEDHDDINTIRDRLLTAQCPRVMLVIPWDSPSLRTPVAMQVVRRCGEANGIEVAIVSTEGEVRAAAHDVGLPAFRSVDAAQRKRRWHKTHDEDDELKPWTPSKRKRREAERAAVERNQVVVQTARRHPAWIALKIGIFVLALLVVAFAALAIIPNAQIVLVPQSTKITASINVLADPQATEVDQMTGHVPAIETAPIVVRETMTVPTTGKKSVPDTRATGRVIFVNQLNSPIRISQGTVVRTSATGQALRYVLTQDVDVPAGIGAQAEGIVEAVEVGAASNVDANLINEIEGVAALAARVSNPDPLTGGGDKEVRAVDPADRTKATEDIRPKLRETALKQLQEKLDSGEFIIPESLSGNILELTFDHEVTEQADDLTLVMRVQYSAEKVQSEDANSLVFNALNAQTPPGYELLPEGMAFQRGEASVISDTQVVTQTLYQFPMQGSGFAAADLDVGAAVEKITGKPLEEATTLLQDSLPLKKEPEIAVFPKWFPWLPWLSFRIQTEVNPQG